MASGIFQKASRCFWSSSSWFSACLISTEAQHVQSTTRSSSQEQNFGVFRRRRPIRLARARSSVADGGASGAFKNLAWAANAAIIQRAPSRLYRLHDHQQPPSPSSCVTPPPSFHPRKSQSFRDLMVVDREDVVVGTCSGPEFIVKSSLAPHTITLAHQPKKVRLFLRFFYLFLIISRLKMMLDDLRVLICILYHQRKQKKN